jgi:PAS domain-containing protein
MSVTSKFPVPGPPHHAVRWVSGDLRALNELLARRAAPTQAEISAQELESAHEELHVADEEIRAQRAELAALREERSAAAQQRRLMLSVLPVATLATDRSGIVLRANHSAAARFNLPVTTLVGKPILGLIAQQDRRRLRTLLESVAYEPVHAGIRLQPRHADETLTDVVIVAEVGSDELTWSIVDSGEAPAADEPAITALAQMCELSTSDLSPEDLLRPVAGVTQSALPPSFHVSVVLGDPVEPSRSATTGSLAQQVDGWQVQAGEGPAATSHAEARTVLVEDLEDAVDWPRFSAVARGVRTVVAVPLLMGERVIGVLSACSPTAHALDPRRLPALETLTSAAGAVLHAAVQGVELRDLAGNLERALVARQVIDEAKGIVMAQRGCTADEAFAHLATLSQHRNVKVRDLAKQLVEQTATGVSRPLA